MEIATAKEKEEEIKKAKEGKKRALEKLRNIYEQQAEASRQERYEGYDLKVRRTMLENDVRQMNKQNYGEAGLENTKLDVGYLEHRLGVLLQMAGREGMPHEELVGQAEEVKKIISELKKLEKAERDVVKDKEQRKKEMDFLIAEAEGNEANLEKMQLGRDIQKLEEELLSKGYSSAEAHNIAYNEVLKKTGIKNVKEEREAKKNISPERIERMMQMGAELGNGGRVLNFGDGLLQYARKQADSLSNIERKMEGMKRVYLAMGE